MPSALGLHGYTDLAVVDVLPSAWSDPEIGEASLLDIEKAYDPNWPTLASSMPFFVTGYPDECSEVSYDAKTIRTDRKILRTTYVEPGPSDSTHTLKVEGSVGLKYFSGLSGGPVFARQLLTPHKAKYIFCGMAFSGGAESGLLHFIDASVLLNALELKLLRDAGVEKS